MKKDSSVSFILEMMKKIDSTYQDVDSVNQDSDANGGQDETGVDDSEEQDEPYVRVGNRVTPKTAQIKTSDDVKNFDVKFTKANGIGRIANDPETNNTENDEFSDFWAQPYVDTMSNLQKVAEFDGDLAKKFNSHIDQFKVTRDSDGIYRVVDSNSPSAFVPGAGKSGNADENNDNIALYAILDTLRKYGIAKARINTPNELAVYLSTTTGMFVPQLSGKKQALKVFNAISQSYKDNDTMAAISDEDMRRLGSKINDIYEQKFDKQKQDGLSNAQARFFVNTFGGGVSVQLASGKTGTKDIGDSEFVGLLKWLPENTPKLRSVSYVKRALQSNRAKNIKFVRDFVFDSRIKHRTLNVNGVGPIDFNEYIDDPVTDKTAEDLMSEATYILSIALDKHNENVLGGERSNFAKRLSGIKGYSSNIVSYSIMDYIINLATILTYSKDSRSRDGHSTGARLIFDDVLSKYFRLIETLNGYGGVNSDTLLSIIPITAFFEDNDGLEYLNSLMRRSDGRNRAILLSVLREAVKNMKGSSIYKLKLPDNDEDVLSLVQQNADSQDVEEVDKPTLYELLSEIVGQGKNETQSKLTNAFKKYLQQNGINNAITCEWNNDNYNSTDKELKGLIGKKSIDIALKDYKILIEYQGEQHYTPSCCRGISPDLTGIGRKDLNTIHTTRGRSSDYIKKSLKPGSEQVIIKLRDEKNLPNYGKFLTIDEFSDRMTSLVEEIVSYMELMHNKKPNTVSKKEFLTYAWEYLGTFIDNGVIVDEELDAARTIDGGDDYRELRDAGRAARSKRGKWEDWGTVTSLISRRRWYEELCVYLQQAADKQKFIAFKERGWNFFYVCPSGGRITDELIKEQAMVPFVTDFTSFLDSNGKEKTIDNYVSKDALVAEGIYKIQGTLRPEFMASNFTYRFSNNEDLENMKWVRPDGASDGFLGNMDNLAETVMTIVRKTKRGL